MRPQPVPETLSMAEAILSSINTPMLAVSADNRFLTANPAAEEFFQVSSQGLAGQAMDDFFDPPVISLLGRARQNGSSVHDQGVEIRSQKLGRKLINIQISP
ncbi:MAG: PAS domain-containing protein, partial [Candidatus Puniceispirillales bacterium]